MSHSVQFAIFCPAFISHRDDMSLKSHILTFAQVYDPKSFHPDLEEFKQLSTSIQYVLVSANLYSAKLGLMRFFKLHYSNLFNKLYASQDLHSANFLRTCIVVG